MSAYNDLKKIVTSKKLIITNFIIDKEDNTLNINININNSEFYFSDPCYIFDREKVVIFSSSEEDKSCIVCYYKCKEKITKYGMDLYRNDSNKVIEYEKDSHWNLLTLGDRTLIVNELVN